MHRKTELILLWILRIGLTAVLLSPLVFSNKFFFPYIVPRATYFQIITEILFAVSVILVAFFPQHRSRWNYLSGSLVIYLAIAGFSTITSADPSKSFIGTTERTFGFYHLLHYGFLFFAAIIALKTHRHWNILFGLSLAVGLYAALNMLLPVLLVATMPPTVAGNPLFLAAYLMLHIFFAAYLMILTKNRWIRVFLGIIIFIFIVTILLSGVRGVFVGLVAAAGFLLTVAAWRLKKNRLHLIGLIVIFIAAYSLVFVNRDLPFVRSNSILSRVTNFSLADETIKARFSMWKMAFKGIQERPLLGWGRENYSLVFNKYFDISFEQANVGEAWEDRTHNIFIEELIDGGFIGLFGYLVLFASAFLIFRRNYIFTAALIAYIVQGMFGVNNLNEHIPFFFLLAYGVFLQRHTILTTQTESSFRRWSAIILSGIILVGIGISSLLFTVRPALGNIKINEATIAAAINDNVQFESAYDYTKKNLVVFPALTAELISLMATSLVQSRALEIHPADSKFLSTIIGDLKRLTQRNPYEQRWIFLYGQLLHYEANRTGNIALLDEAKIIWEKLNASVPHRRIFQQMLINHEGLRQKLSTATSTSINSVQ